MLSNSPVYSGVLTNTRRAVEIVGGRARREALAQQQAGAGHTDTTALSVCAQLAVAQAACNQISIARVTGVAGLPVQVTPLL